VYLVALYLPNLSEARNTEQIKDNIHQMLPNVSSECMQNVLQKLDEVGVETVEYLAVVPEGDLAGLLKPIQIQKLLLSWASRFSDDCFCFAGSNEK
jgi:hypothetical protein